DLLAWEEGLLPCKRVNALLDCQTRRRGFSGPSAWEGAGRATKRAARAPASRRTVRCKHPRLASLSGLATAATPTVQAPPRRLRLFRGGGARVLAPQTQRRRVRRMSGESEADRAVV